MSTVIYRPFHITVAVENGLCALFRLGRSFTRAQIGHNRDAPVPQQGANGSHRSPVTDGSIPPELRPSSADPSHPIGEVASRISE